MCRVSVLVAVYNTEKYLRECLDSLLRQTLRDIQIICVDDCSTDKSPEILDAYASEDSRVEVIHLDRNQGIANARNVGLGRVKSEFVCFLDSDDWMSDDALEKAVEVYDKHERTDCVLFRVMTVYPDREEEYAMNPFDVMDGRKAFVDSLTWKIHGVYMVRAGIHLKYKYDDSSHAYSDENTTRIHYYNSREVRCCDGIYYYRQNAESVTHKVSVRRFDYLKANESMKIQLVGMDADDNVIDFYENVRWLNVIDLYMFYYNNRNKLNSADCRYGLSEIKRIWKGIELDRLDGRSSIHKFGYMPLRRSWTAFRIQEEVYFCLRSIKDNLLLR